jgi:peptidoglycan/xylan/chitin deacetylase (PgdA/CDA1 family)
MYHEVLPDDITLPAWTIIRESDFRWQMRYLEAHFDVITIDQALKRFHGNIPSRKPFAIVTFDDGYSGNRDTVLPLMESMGLPFTLYVATKAIVEQSLYWYDRVISLLDSQEDVQVNITLGERTETFRIPWRGRENDRWQAMEHLLTRLKQIMPEERDKIVRFILDNSGGGKSLLKMLTPENLNQLSTSDCVTIGSHTHGHELLDQLDLPEILQTLQTANQHIIRMTGFLPKHFAYPNGNFNERVIDQVKKMGFETAVTTIPGMWSYSNCRLEIPRLGIGRFETKDSFRARLSGYL